MTVWIETQRLVLREPTDEDVDACWRIHGDPRTYAHRPEARMKTRSEAVDLIAEWSSHWRRYGFGYAAVVDEAGDVVGFCGIKHQKVSDLDALNLYYRFDAGQWGRGYATEAAAGVLDWARRERREFPVLARIARANPSSARVAERIGLHRTELADVGDDVAHEIWRSSGG